MTPVDDGSTCGAGTLSSFARARLVASATLSPVRVAQLALPALTSTARARPPVAARLRRVKRTGAACTRFVVNTPAAAASTSETISARSGLATLRIPAYKAE
jgi:hypothetical protein